MAKKELKDMKYEELEARSKEVLKALSDTSLPLDEASKLYQEGKAIAKEMEKRLSDLEKSVTDTIVED